MLNLKLYPWNKNKTIFAYHVLIVNYCTVLSISLLQTVIIIWLKVTPFFPKMHLENALSECKIIMMPSVPYKCTYFIFTYQLFTHGDAYNNLTEYTRAITLSAKIF